MNDSITKRKYFPFWWFIAMFIILVPVVLYFYRDHLEKRGYHKFEIYAFNSTVESRAESVGEFLLDFRKESRVNSEGDWMSDFVDFVVKIQEGDPIVFASPFQRDPSDVVVYLIGMGQEQGSATVLVGYTDVIRAFDGEYEYCQLIFIRREEVFAVQASEWQLVKIIGLDEYNDREPSLYVAFIPKLVHVNR